jgi:putative DNA primase/helicase
VALKLVSSADTPASHTEWLWEGRIPRASLTGLVGEENFGKTTWLCWLATQLSRGELKGDSLGRPANTLFLTAEDSPEKTLKNRLSAAGADHDHIFFLPYRTEEDGVFQYVTLPGDVVGLGEAIAAYNIELVIIDPINAHLGEIDGHKNTAVRSALGPVAAMAEDADLAVVCVMHINKGADKSERAAMTGSSAYREAFRSTLVFGLDPESPDKDGDDRVIIHGDKHNLGKRQHGFKVVVREREVVLPNGAAYKYPYHVLGDQTMVSAEDVLGASTEKKPPNREALDEAIAFLEKTLLDGPRPVKDVNREARSLGISEKTLQRARKNMNIKSSEIGFHDGWQIALDPVWVLPAALREQKTATEKPKAAPRRRPKPKAKPRRKTTQATKR